MGVEPTRTGCKRGVVEVASLQSTSELCKELGWDNVLQCFVPNVLGHLLNGPSEY